MQKFAHKVNQMSIVSILTAFIIEVLLVHLLNNVNTIWWIVQQLDSEHVESKTGDLAWDFYSRQVTAKALDSHETLLYSRILKSNHSRSCKSVESSTEQMFLPSACRCCVSSFVYIYSSWMLAEHVFWRREALPRGLNLPDPFLSPSLHWGGRAIQHQLSIAFQCGSRPMETSKL